MKVPLIQPEFKLFSLLVTLDLCPGWGFKLYPPQRAGQPGSYGKSWCRCLALHGRASRCTSGCRLPRPLPRENLPHGDEKRWKGLSEFLDGRGGERRGRRQERCFRPPPRLSSNPGQQWGVYCLGSAALTWDLQRGVATTCWFLQGTQAPGGIRSGLFFPPPLVILSHLILQSPS